MDIKVDFLFNDTNETYAFPPGDCKQQFLLAHKCEACKRTLLETAGPIQQAIKIKCRKCGAWNVFDKPLRPEAAKASKTCDSYGQ